MEERRNTFVVSLHDGTHPGGGRRHALVDCLGPLPLRMFASGLVRQILPLVTSYQERRKLTQLGYTAVVANGFDDAPFLM